MASDNINVLIISKALTFYGGVVMCLSLVMKCFSKHTHFEHFSTGQRSSTDGLFKKLIYLFIDNIRLARLIRKKQFDCVHLNPSLQLTPLLRDGFLISTLGLLGFKKIVIFIHGWDDHIATRISSNRLLRSLFKKTFGEAAVILVLATRFKLFLEELGIDPDRISVVSATFSGKVFEGIQASPSSSGMTILFMSRLVSGKGVYELLESFKQVQTRFQDTKLVIIGDGEERKPMDQWVKDNQLSDHIKFAGFLSEREKAQTLVDGDLFVFPTTYAEGCPAALIEAMAAGLAVITTRAGGIPDIIQQDENGILLDDVDPGTIAAAIEKMLTDKALLARVKRNNRQKAWEQYEAKVLTANLERAYRRASSVEKTN